jgi:hypothetical protein
VPRMPPMKKIITLRRKPRMESSLLEG